MRGAKATYLVVAVREVEPGHVHAGVKHLDEHIGLPAGWAEGANDFGLAKVEVDRLEDVVEPDAARVSATVCFYHVILAAGVGKILSRFVYLDLSLPKLLLLNYKRSPPQPINKF